MVKTIVFKEEMKKSALCELVRYFCEYQSTRFEVEVDKNVHKLTRGRCRMAIEYNGDIFENFGSFFDKFREDGRELI